LLLLGGAHVVAQRLGDWVKHQQHQQQQQLLLQLESLLEVLLQLEQQQ
jgi:hypothetical protein